MDWVLAMLIGLLYGSGLFLMMRRNVGSAGDRVRLVKSWSQFAYIYCRRIWSWCSADS